MNLSADALYKMSDLEVLAAYVEARRALCHAVEARATMTSDALSFERACHRVRVSCNDC
jgi:hypothetical protein